MSLGDLLEPVQKEPGDEGTALVGDLLTKQKEQNDRLEAQARVLVDRETLEEKITEISKRMRDSKTDYVIKIQDQYRGLIHYNQ